MREQVEVLEHHSGADAQLTDLLPLCSSPVPAADDAYPATSIVPSLGSSRKLMQRRSVLFPEPERPKTTTTSSPDLQVDVLQHLVPVEGLPQVLDPHRP